MEIGHVNRLKHGESVSGDGIVILQTPTDTLFAVIDGVGHGCTAAMATQEAESFLRMHPTLPLEELLQACDLALRRTVGVVMAVFRIIPAHHEMQYAAVGNVEMVCPTNHTIRPAPYPGILGGRFRKAIEHRYLLQANDLLLVHTDGIGREIAFFEGNENDLEKMSVQAIADRALKDHGNAYDDAACLVVRYRM